MCVIINGKIKHIVGNVDLKSAWSSNPHGAGILIPHKTDPGMIKGIMSLEGLRAALKRISTARGKDQEIAIHLRMATHGSISQLNTHPFQVTDRSWLMHNGILSGLGTSGTDGTGSSDSAHLARILSRLAHSDRLSLLRALPGKFAYMDRDQILLFGQFEKDGKVMLSNTYFKPCKMFTHTAREWTYTRNGASGGWTKLSEPQRARADHSAIKALRCAESLKDLADRARTETTIEDTITEGSQEFYELINQSI